MQLKSLCLAACLGFAAARSSLKERLMDVESTSLTIENTRERLDNSEIVLHLTRVDDLIDDEDEYKLLLERQTHIALSIRLDVADGSLSINGERLPLDAAPGGGVAVSAIRAEAYSLPADLAPAFYEPAHVQALVDALSTGIVSVSIRLESEVVPVEAVGSVIDDDTVLITPLHGVSMRKIGVFMKIDEIEGKTFEHSKTVYTPILQMLVKSQSIETGEQITSIQTISVGDQPVAASSLPSQAETLPQLHDMLPPMEPELEAAEEEGAAADEEPHQLWKTHDLSHTGLWGFLRAIFGQPRFDSAAAPHHAKHSCPGCLRGPRKGLALAPHPVHSDEDEREDRPPHHHKHHGHHKPCFWRGFAHGFASVFVTIGAFIAALVSSLPGAMVVGLVCGGLLFKVTRSIVRRVRARRCAAAQLPQYVDELEGYPDEKVDYMVQPPTYEDTPSESTMPLFDADAEEAMDEKKAAQ